MFVESSWLLALPILQDRDHRLLKCAKNNLRYRLPLRLRRGILRPEHMFEENIVSIRPSQNCRPAKTRFWSSIKIMVAFGLVGNYERSPK